MFTEKLNKLPDGVHVVEERKALENGVWEGYLDHDNANHRTLQIWTGSRFTGDQVENYFLSTSAEMPWKTYLKVLAGAAEVYVTYETPGDQVEAEDINLLQDTISATQKEFEQYRVSGVIDGGNFIRGDD